MAFTIIEPGNPKPEKFYSGTCQKCGCRFECDDRDVDVAVLTKPKTNCPTCKRVVTVEECDE